MIQKCTRNFFLFFLILAASLKFAPAYAQAYTESFNDISTLPGSGWHIQNNSTPVGVLGWFQGTATNATPTPGPFNANTGAANAYIAANFNSTGSSGTISNWLVTPNRILRNGDVFTFYTRKPTISGGMTDYPDRLEVRMSTNGASTNVGTGATGLGDFTTLLLSVNPTLVANVYPQTWTQFTITISGLPAPTSGRIAFRYFVTGAGSLGTNSDYIGIDDVVYTPYVCPVLTLNPTTLPGGTAGSAYSQSLAQTGALGAPSYAITAGALPPGLTLSTGGTLSGTPTATGTFNFTATVSDASGCTGSRAYSITVVCAANPITFTAPSLICGNSPVTLTASPAGGTFSGTGVSGNTFDPSAGTQTLTYDYTDPYGCSFSSSALFTVAQGGVTSVSPGTQTICSGDAIANIIASNTVSGATFSWTRDNTASVTGIPASGAGNTITGSLVNTTTAPVTVTFSIAGTANGCTDGTKVSTVLVNPRPVVNAIAPQTICSGSAITTVNPSGAVANTTFTWSRNNTTAVTGIAASGSGAISGSLVNTTNAPVVVTFTVTPSVNGCTGTPVTFNVTVNPTPTATASIASQTVCSGAITPINLTGNVTGTTFNWTRDNTVAATGIAASGSGNISGTLTNTTSNPVTVTFTITPTANGCTGTPITATVTVGAAPVIVCPANISISNITNTCGAPATYTVSATGIPAPDISYSFSGATAGSGSGTGSGSTFNVGVTTVTLTATNSCGTNSCSFTVTVLDTQNPAISCPAPVSVSCAGEVPAVDISSVIAADNCPGVAVTHVGDVISNQTCVGRYTIERTYRATDAAGNAVTCTQTITVNDQTAPVINCPANITTATPIGSCNAVVNFTVAATDNCGGPVTITTMPASGSVFPMGTTTVTATATDACGNSSVCTFTITVTDGQLPVIAAQPSNQVICAEGDAGFSVTASNVLSYQWQIQQGGNWVNINGANNSAYTIANVTPAMSGRVYRVMLVGHCTTIYSDPATLTVNQLPQPAILTPAEVCVDDRSIQLQATPAGGAFSGVGITGNNWNLEIPAAGNQTISYTYTDGNGCSVTTSKVVNLRFCEPFRSVLELQAYPNPTDGKVTVKTLITMESNWSIAVNDLYGRLVWRKDIPFRKGWNVFEVDLTGKLPGMYIITLSRGGERKADIKVLKAN